MRLLLTIALCLASLSALEAQAAIAFITEVQGSGQVVRGQAGEPAAVGGQLADGDLLTVDEGKVVLIYLSGRTVEVTAGTQHAVKAGGGESSALMGRVMDTLGEIAGPQSEIAKPTVHGMARDLVGLEGALPANTAVSDPDFWFVWDPLEGVEEYEFTLTTADGNIVAQQTLRETQVQASSLQLQRGRRYSWSVQEGGSFLPRSSGKSWVEVADTAAQASLTRDIKQIDEQFSGKTADLLRAITYYRGGYYFEAERVLTARQQSGITLTPPEQKLLTLTYAKMGRWEKLPDTEEGSESSDNGEG